MKTQSQISLKATTILFFFLFGLFPVALAVIGIKTKQEVHYQIKAMGKSKVEAKNVVKP